MAEEMPGQGIGGSGPIGDPREKKSDNTWATRTPQEQPKQVVLEQQRQLTQAVDPRQTDEVIKLRDEFLKSDEIYRLIKKSPDYSKYAHIPKFQDVIQNRKLDTVPEAKDLTQADGDWMMHIASTIKKMMNEDEIVFHSPQWYAMSTVFRPWAKRAEQIDETQRGRTDNSPDGGIN